MKIQHGSILKTKIIIGMAFSPLNVKDFSRPFATSKSLEFAKMHKIIKCLIEIEHFMDKECPKIDAVCVYLCTK